MLSCLLTGPIILLLDCGMHIILKSDRYSSEVGIVRLANDT